jgi:hypothetical protein
MAKKTDTYLRIEKCVGYIYNLEETPRYISFKPSGTLTLAQLQALSIEFGTDRINFNFGADSEPGYSSYTPGCSGYAGHVEIYK